MNGAATPKARRLRGRAAGASCVALFAALALSGELRAQHSERQPVEPTPVDPAPTTPASNAQEAKQAARWTFFESELDLVTVAEMCASGLGLHLEYDRAKLDGRISLDRPGNFTPRELWDVFNRELAELGEASDNSST